MLEIGRERAAGARLQKEADVATRRTEQGEARHRSELQTLQASRADARHQAGVLVGSLAAVRDANAAYVRELEIQRQQASGVVAIRSVRRKGDPVAAPAQRRPRAVREGAATKKPV